MCGRYTFQHVESLRRLIESITGEAYAAPAARYNVAPSQENPIVAVGADGHLHGTTMRWGLVPYWDKSEKPKIAPINARSEEMLGKPMFKQAVQKRRGAIPADGYFEWQRPDERTKIPHFISLRERRPFFIAGIFEPATAARPATYALLTCTPNPLMAAIHDRMPVILPASAVGRWLGPGPLTPDDAASICVPYASGEMQAWAVSSVVNHARHDVPECIEPVLA